MYNQLGDGLPFAHGICAQISPVKKYIVKIYQRIDRPPLLFVSASSLLILICPIKDSFIFIRLFGIF
jgi:hypothetical protein